VDGKLYLANKVRDFRTKNKMTQKDLAEKVGVSRQTIIKIEKGNYSPSALLGFEIAKVFGVELNDVFQMKEKKDRKNA